MGIHPKGPGRYVVYTWGPEGFPYSYSGAQLPTVLCGYMDPSHELPLIRTPEDLVALRNEENAFLAPK